MCVAGVDEVKGARSGDRPRGLTGPVDALLVTAEAASGLRRGIVLLYFQKMGWPPTEEDLIWGGSGSQEADHKKRQYSGSEREKPGLGLQQGSSEGQEGASGRAPGLCCETVDYAGWVVGTAQGRKGKPRLTLGQTPQSEWCLSPHLTEHRP